MLELILGIRPLQSGIVKTFPALSTTAGLKFLKLFTNDRKVEVFYELLILKERYLSMMIKMMHKDDAGVVT